MDKHPKRKKSKDNPYQLVIENNNFHVVFKDSNNIIQDLKISENIYGILSDFELEDISQMHKDDNHIDFRKIDNSEVIELFVSQNSIIKQKSVEDQVEEKLQNDELYRAIQKLPTTQKERIKKYYFEEKTLQEIANEECCSVPAIKYSIDNGIKKLKEILKK